MSRSSRRSTGGGHRTTRRPARRTARSAITGRYLRAATAARRPRTTVVSTARAGTHGRTRHGVRHGTRRSGVVRDRSAVTGRYVSAATAARHPRTTISTYR